MISVNIATHKKREKHLKRVLACLFQTTTAPTSINVYLNDYKKPTWLKNLQEKHGILNVFEQPDGDVGAAAKFYSLSKQKTGVYITLDDDLLAN